MLTLFISGCENRKSVNTGSGSNGGDDGEGTISYNIDGYAYRDLVNRTDIVRVSVIRDSIPYTSADVKVNNYPVSHQGEGIYSRSSYGLLDEGDNQLRVQIEEDNFNKVLYFTIPDSFQVINISRHNPGAFDRFIRWSQSAQATDFYLAVRHKDYDQHGVEQYSVTIASPQYYWNIPTQAFRTPDLFIVTGVYYLYILGYASGLSSFEGAGFTIPSGSEGPGIPGIPGNFSAGLLAPVDSFIVTH